MPLVSTIGLSLLVPNNLKHRVLPHAFAKHMPKAAKMPYRLPARLGNTETADHTNSLKSN